MKIWARIIDDAKLKRDFVYKIEGEYNPEDIFVYMSDICEALSIPVPIILVKHQKTLRDHGQAKFLPDEFVENFPYDKLIIEVFDDKNA